MKCTQGAVRAAPPAAVLESSAAERVPWVVIGVHIRTEFPGALILTLPFPDTRLTLSLRNTYNIYQAAGLDIPVVALGQEPSRAG